MVLHHLNTSGHILLVSPKLQILLNLRTLCVHVIQMVLLRFLRTLVVTTTVTLVIMLLVSFGGIFPDNPLWDGQQWCWCGGSLLYSPQHAMVHQDTR